VRNLLFVVFLILILCVPALSKEEYSVAFGYRLGVGTSGMSGDGAVEGASSGFSAVPVVLYLEGHLTPQISIMPEVSWLKYTIGSDTGDEKYNYYYDYLAIPLNVKFKLLRGIFRPFIFAGPYYAFTLGADYALSGSLTHHDISEETSSSNYGLNLGVGFDAYFNELGPVFSMDLRRTIGMSNVYSDNSTKATTSANLFMIIGLGWGF
jgi:hypothetical protein